MATPGKSARGEPAAAPAEGVLFRAPSGERAKRVRPGFAWDLFLFAPLFGAPLFLRRLPHWGAAVLALWIVDLFLHWAARGRVWLPPAQTALFAAFLGLQLWLGLKGNALTARAYRARGWRVENARAPGVRQALQRWRLTEE